MSAEPTHSLEIERKYDVDDRTELPDWARLPGVASIDAPEGRALDARYLDTHDLALARVRTALRRRTGGPDAGWHIKASTDAGKLESHWPLDDEAPADADPVVPEAVRAALAPLAAGPFVVIARIRNDRTAYALHDTRGGLVAEVVDDHVIATDTRRGTETSWREWEVELGPAAPADSAARAAFFAAADALVASAGGRVAASDSKLARALSV